MESTTQMKVREVMTRGVITVNMDAPLKEVAKILVDEGISGVVVVAPDNAIMGVISEIDLVQAFDRKWDELTADDIMSSSVKAIEPEMILYDAAKMMKELHVHRLLVLPKAPGHIHVPIGILCASDIVKAIIERK